MPIYEYTCPKCKEETEILVPQGEPVALKCDSCQEELRKEVPLITRTPKKWGDSPIQGGY